MRRVQGVWLLAV
uniref:Uncharacterized protein n=1 Tax=Anguilla anguilla TaxID=7936 RepID=A0A0E9U5J2_ANGAN